MKWKAIVNNTKVLEICQTNNSITVDGVAIDIKVKELAPRIYHVLFKNKSYRIQLLSISAEKKLISLLINGKNTEIKTETEIETLLNTLGFNTSTAKKSDQLKSPMPGKIIDILVKEGDEVQEGESILILEAMKMENVIKSKSTVVIKKIHVDKGSKVEKNQVLIEFTNH